MIQRLLLTCVLALAPIAPAMAAEDDFDLGADAPPSMQMPDLSQLKGLSLKPSSGGITDMASAMKLIKIGQALKAKQKVSNEDLQFVRSYLQKLGADGGTSADSLKKLDQVLEQLQRRTAQPTEADELMRELADGADMNDLPRLDD